VDNAEAALASAYDLAGENDLICLTGSLYLLGHLRPLLQPGS
jgi:folylpolyglutamate synthase/dihydropteroate synthase